MKMIKTFEAYNSFEEFNSFVIEYLKNYNLTSTQLIDLVDRYQYEIEETFNSGAQPLQIVNKIVKDLNLDNNSSYPGVPAGSGSGDIGFTLNTYSKVPVSTFSSEPSKVSDLRYLKRPKKNKIKKVKDL